MSSTNSPRFKDKVIKAFPVLSKLYNRDKPVIRFALVAGATAGDVTVADIRAADELVSVINLTDLTDLTSEFSIKIDGKINNTGGTSTASKKVLVVYHPWTIDR